MAIARGAHLKTRRQLGPAIALVLIIALVGSTSPIGSRVLIPREAAGASASQPNILLIVSDDQEFQTFTRDLMPSTFSRIVDEGTSFSNAYVNTSLCCPSRAQILTGRTELTGGVDSTAAGTLQMPTVLDAAFDSGYRTIVSGKLLNNTACADRPEVDSWLCIDEEHYTLKDPDLSLNGAPFATAPGWTGELLANHLVSEVQATPSERPVFAVLSAPAPHHPANDERYGSLNPVLSTHDPSVQQTTVGSSAPGYRWRPQYSEAELAEIDEGRRRAARSVRALDDDIAAVLDGFGPRLDNTLVIYISDNGFSWGSHRLIGKTAPYEEQVNVPLVVSWPGRVPRGVTRSMLVANSDIAHTIAAAMGQPWIGDGRDLVPQANGISAGRSALLLSFCQGVGQCLPLGSLKTWTNQGHSTEVVTGKPPGWRAVVTREWKYVEYDTGERELYDLSSDPFELTNLSSDPSHSTTESGLAAELGVLARTNMLDMVLHSGPPAVGTAQVVTLRYSMHSRTSSVKCRWYLEGTTTPAWEWCPHTSTVLGPLDPGTWTVELQAVDRAPDESGKRRRDQTPVVVTFTIDANPPPVLTKPDRYVAEGGATALSIGPTGTSAECRTNTITTENRINEGTWEACTPWDETGYVGPNVEGTWFLEARALNEIGEPVGTPAAAIYTIDRTGPKAIWERRALGVTGSADETFSFRFSEHVRNLPVCRIDGVIVPCRDWSTELTGIAPGSHLFRVTARDVAGNVKASDIWFTVDDTAPDLALSPLPDTLAPDDPSPALQFSSTEPTAWFDCSMNGSPWLQCTSDLPTDIWLDSPGTHQIQVRSRYYSGDPNTVATATIERVP